MTQSKSLPVSPVFVGQNTWIRKKQCATPSAFDICKHLVENLSIVIAIMHKFVGGKNLCKVAYQVSENVQSN